MCHQEADHPSSTTIRKDNGTKPSASALPDSRTGDVDTLVCNKELLEGMPQHSVHIAPHMPILEARRCDEEALAEPSHIDTDRTSPGKPNIVYWESPGTADKAINWNIKKKWSNMATISIITFLTPLASTIIAPAVPQILHSFNSSDKTLGSLLVSIYILGYAIGPLFLAPLSEVYGRLPVLNVCTALFLIWSIACALAPNFGSLLVFRILAGVAGACPLAVGGGSIADLFVQDERGLAMSIFIAGPLVGPVVGPVAGGFLAENVGWRWSLWVVAIIVSLIIARSESDLYMTVWPRSRSSGKFSSREALSEEEI